MINTTAHLKESDPLICIIAINYIVVSKESAFYKFTSHFLNKTTYGYNLPMDVSFLKMPGDKLADVWNMLL